nr:MAG TPA: protein of unknown function (DUF5096) [Inoviridae sp.]
MLPHHERVVKRKLQKGWAYYTHAHRLPPSRQSLRIESPYQPDMEGQRLCLCGDGGRGGDAIA